MLHEMRTVERGGGGPREVQRLVGDRIAGVFQTEVGESGQTVLISTHQATAVAGGGERGEGRFGPPELPGRLEVLTPAPFMKPWEARELGRVWELAWYDFPPGSVQQALDAFGEALPHREEFYPVVGCWTVDVGPWTDRIYILFPYKDWDHRDEVTKRLLNDRGWPPAPDAPATRAGNKLLLPVANSALH